MPVDMMKNANLVGPAKLDANKPAAGGPSTFKLNMENQSSNAPLALTGISGSRLIATLTNGGMSGGLASSRMTMGSASTAAPGMAGFSGASMGSGMSIGSSMSATGAGAVGLPGSAGAAMGGGLGSASAATGGDAIAGQANATGGSSQAQLMQATQGMQEMQMSFNMQYLQLQNSMQNDNRQFTMVSNIMKTKHDTVKNTISNIH